MRHSDLGGWLVTLALVLCVNVAGAYERSSNSERPAALNSLMPNAECVGSTRLRFFGLRIYDARLWAEADFNPLAFTEHSFALELTYHRNFAGSAIAQRSLKEMRRQGKIEPSMEARWSAELDALIPDVTPGMLLTGVYHPQHGLQLWRGNEPIGSSNDVVLAQRFFGIWLSTQTSESALRKELIGMEGDSCI